MLTFSLINGIQQGEAYTSVEKNVKVSPEANLPRNTACATSNIQSHNITQWTNRICLWVTQVHQSVRRSTHRWCRRFTGGLSICMISRATRRSRNQTKDSAAACKSAEPNSLLKTLVACAEMGCRLLDLGPRSERVRSVRISRYCKYAFRKRIDRHLYDQLSTEANAVATNEKQKKNKEKNGAVCCM